jgi:hypothetical protein
MANATVKERVKGGLIVRDSTSGRFVSVSTSKSTSLRNAKTGEVVREASNRRSGAMKRLVNR